MHRDAAETRGWAEESADGTARRCSVGSCQTGRRMGLDVKTPKCLSYPPSRPACSTENGALDWIREGERQGRWGAWAMEPAGSLLHQPPAWSPRSQARLEGAQVALCSPGPTDHSAATNHSRAHTGSVRRALVQPGLRASPLALRPGLTCAGGLCAPFSPTDPGAQKRSPVSEGTWSPLQSTRQPLLKQENKRGCL